MKTFTGNIANIVSFFDKGGDFTNIFESQFAGNYRRKPEIEASPLVGKVDSKQAAIRFNFWNRRGYKEKWSLRITFRCLGNNQMVATHKTKFNIVMFAYATIAVCILSFILIGTLLYCFHLWYLPTRDIVFLTACVTVILMEWEIVYLRRKSARYVDSIYAALEEGLGRLTKN